MKTKITEYQKEKLNKVSEALSVNSKHLKKNIDTSDSRLIKTSLKIIIEYAEQGIAMTEV